MRKALLALLPIVALVGCSELGRRVDFTTKTPTDVRPEDVPKNALGLPLTYNYQNQQAATYFVKVYDRAPAAEKTVVRNRILFELLGVIDTEFNAYSKNIRSERAYKDSIVRVVSIVLTGTATLLSAPAANTLAAIDTGLKGANDAIDTNAFRNNAPELLINTMRANRAKVAAQIYDNLSKADAQYPLEAGIQDLHRYYAEGTITAALVSLTATTAAAATAATNTALERRREALEANGSGAALHGAWR